MTEVRVDEGGRGLLRLLFEYIIIIIIIIMCLEEKRKTAETSE
jgi:hypothetical protein